MTVGEKIKKYRQLKKMTQKELGMKIGFSASTADARIRKYESSQMSPKMNLRQKLAEALDVDLAALSDIDIRTYKDIIHVLFFLEETVGLEINRCDDSIQLIIDNKDGKNDLLMTYLFSWYSQKKTFLSIDDQNEGREKYELWKARFPKDLDLLWNDLRSKIKACYDPLVAELENSAHRVETLGEFIQHVQDVIETDCRIAFDTKPYGAHYALAITFYTSQLIDPPDDAKNALAMLFYDFRTLEDYGLPLQDTFNLRQDGIQITYFLPLPLLVTMSSFLKEWKGFVNLKKTNTYSDGELEFMQTKFNLSIQDFKDENLREYVEFQYPQSSKETGNHD